jgi:hypothetical protein
VSELAVVKVENRVTVVRPATSALSVAAPGPQGPPGPAGPSGAAGGSVYTHDQSSPAGSWIVTHNLGRVAFITVVDSAGREVLADIDQSDPNTASIVFATPTSGRAVVS